MTRIHVDTGALLAGAARAQRTSREAAEHARSVQSVLGRLDFEVRAREHIDQRIAAVSRSVSANAQDLQRHAAFLTQAADRYEKADQAVLKAIKGFSGRYPNESGGDWLRRVFGGLWRGMTSLLAVVDVKLLGSVFATLYKLVDVVSDGIGLYADFFNKFVKVSMLETLFQRGWLSSKSLTWAMRFQHGARVFGAIAVVATAVWDGAQEFASSTGSLIRRVSNGVVVGGAKAVGGLIGAKIGLAAGAFIGAKAGLMTGALVGTAVGGPVGTVVGAAAGVALGVGLAWFGRWAAEQVVNYEVQGSSIKSVIGDVVETGAQHIQSTAVEIGRSSAALGESMVHAASNVLKTAAPIVGPALFGVPAAAGSGGR